MSKILMLGGTAILGSGNERVCYIHPDNPKLCVKVYHTQDEIFKHTKVMRQQNEMEFFYFRSLSLRKVPFLYLPRCYGWVETDLGRGLLFDRIVNDDGSPSQSITELMVQGKISKSEVVEILNNIGDYLNQYKVNICDVNPDHILMQNVNGELIPKIIDGVGSRYNNWKLYIISYCPYFSKKKIKHQWDKMKSMVLGA
ncbi:hypothetical protein DS893_05420 [Vibrionales bacterium C3R12]|nr:hypothetical protein DS893_05420 [Vibrionales bacterium C3R12]